MAYLSLYRKYRSQSFEELAGQDHVTRTLQNAIRNGRVAHAYLLCGPRGTGKTSTARLLAKAVNCETGPRPDPCNTCDACVQITEGSFLDLKEIDAASNRSIDDVRDLRDNVAFTPAQGRFKVYIVDEAHQLTSEAFNALLKTLEEPPPHVIFILATTDTHKIPTTISSRCQKFEFRRASMQQLRERVALVAKEEGAEIEPAALDLIARDANGGWRDALSLLEQVLAFSDGRITAKDVYAVLGTVEAETLYRLADEALKEHGREVWGLLDELIAEGKDPRQLIRDITAHYRELLMAAVGCPPDGEPDQVARITEQARAYGHKRLVAAIEVLAQTEREARWSEQPRLLLELAAVRLMHPREAAPAPVAVARPPSTAASPAPAARPTPPRAAEAARTVPPLRTDDEPPPPAGAPPDEPSPFVDETPPVSRNGGAARARGFGADPLPPPPLTVGDARTGAGDEDEDFTDAFGMPPARPAQPAPARPTPSPSATPPHASAAPLELPEPAVSAASAASVDVDALRSRWRVIGEELKRGKKANIQACLVDTVPDRMERDVLVIRFPTRTMAEMFSRKGKEFSEPLCAAIQRLAGVGVRVRAEYGEGGAAAPAATAAGPPPRSAVSAGGTRPAPEPRENRAAAPSVAPSLLPADGSSPAVPAAPGGGGSELVHNVLDVFDGKILDDHDLQ